MKIRKGFVTNSSSSSFILTFKDKKDYKKFKDNCTEYYYEEIYNLINKIKTRETNKKDMNEIKKEAKEFLYNCYTFEEKRKYLDIHIDESVGYPEKINIEKEILESEEYKLFINDYIKTTDYFEKCEKIDEDEIVVMGEIWDSNGGLVEYAIRNGILEREFRNWTRIVNNVG